MTSTATRYHDISCGHRVVGHENKCRHLHGHNYRVTFTCRGNLDAVGRVLDFSEIKSRLCMWVEDNWDHRFLVWEKDDLVHRISCLSAELCTSTFHRTCDSTLQDSLVWLPFNPTAENMAQYLVEVIGPKQLEGTGITLICVTVEETRKCSASFSID